MTNDEINNIPATIITLTGQHLIEASAGTGKTWTLTGIVLRLLIEAKRPPEQIICTTFTRAASAEMRERIMARLHEFFYLLQWLEKISGDSTHHQWLYLEDAHSEEEDEQDTKTDPKQQEKLTIFRQQREEKLLIFAKQTSHDMSESIQDPVNVYLIHYLLDSFASYPLSMAIRRTQLLLISMDKLFVGTLDSLAQRWLTEYSVETGYQKGMKISDNDEDKVADIIHDEIRQFHARTHANNPILYQLLQQSGQLTAVADHLQSVNKAMQFISAPIDEIQTDDFDFNSYQVLLDTLARHDYSDIQPYLDSDYCDSEGMAKRSPVATKITSISIIFQAIKEYGIGFFVHLNKDADSFLLNLSKAFIAYEDGGKVFKKANQSNREYFIALPTIRLLGDLIPYIDSLNHTLDNSINVLNRQIALAVRHRLPIQLEENNQTTFSLQMVRLNQALSGKQGQKLSRYIRHHYPVALIDESQDINGEQASMIKSIYMPNQSMANTDEKTSVKNNKPTFLLLVGDPKQAIYGFRGGDVANYNAMKKQFRNIYTLNVNRRSNAGVVNSLNEWFTEDNDSLRELGEGIYYHHIEAFKEKSRLRWHNDNNGDDSDKDNTQYDLFSPVSHVSENISNNPSSHPINQSILGKQAVAVIRACYAKKGEEQDVIGADKYEGLAKHIQYLLYANETIEGKPITAQDIAILARGRKDLQQASWALEKLGIATVKTAEISVFSSQMATDLLAILQAMQHPFRTDFVNRALTTAWYGLTLKQVKLLEKNNDTPKIDSAISVNCKDSMSDVSYSDFQIHLQKSEQLWSDYGVLSALQFLLGDCLFTSSQNNTSENTKRKNKKVSVWEQLAHGAEGERNLLDLRQLLELLTSNTRGMTAAEVIKWLAQQRHKMPSDEDNKQQPIPTESGVQMMTIHKAKGLEFPIVYILGMDGSAKNDVKKGDLAFFPYIANGSSTTGNSTSHQDRRLSPIKQDAQGTDYQALVNRDNLGEAKRIAYVALTRASEQVYVVVSDHASKTALEYRPANIWLEAADKAYMLPERLIDHIDWIECADIIDRVTETGMGKIDNQQSDNAQKIHKAERINYPNYDKVIKHKYFVGWRKTSFTALSRQLDKHNEDVAIAEPDYLFEDGLFFGNGREGSELSAGMPVLESESNLLLSNPLLFLADNIRFTFVRGAGAGTFLHQVFELMDFNNPQNWSEQIDKGLREYGLPTTYQSTGYQNTQDHHSEIPIAHNENDVNNTPHQQLKSWLTDVIHSPLKASGQKLIDIPINNRKAEMGFDMGLSESFRIEKINDVLIKHLGADSDKLLTLNSSDSQYYRYLRGEIDLVYTHDGKYYVVDYKSNHLGNHISDYSHDSLAKAMSKAGYWLQALIYQVALHRFLRLRLIDYIGNETRYLGAVEYLFIRGCVAQQDGEEYTSYGKMVWDIPFDLVEDMDKVFG